MLLFSCIHIFVLFPKLKLSYESADLLYSWMQNLIIKMIIDAKV